MGKIDDLKKEIALLKKKESKVSEYKQLKAERNRLKYAKLYSIARKLKQTGKGIGEAIRKKAESQRNQPKTRLKKVKQIQPRTMQQDMGWIMKI